jgi:hypothetical protein
MPAFQGGAEETTIAFAGQLHSAAASCSFAMPFTDAATVYLGLGQGGTGHSVKQARYRNMAEPPGIGGSGVRGPSWLAGGLGAGAVLTKVADLAVGIRHLVADIVGSGVAPRAPYRTPTWAGTLIFGQPATFPVVLSGLRPFGA